MTFPYRILVRELSKYTFPHGYWGGYAKFYEPNCRGKVGTLIINKVRSIIDSEHNANQTIDELIILLTNKNIKHSNHKKIITVVVCTPTEEADELVQILQRLKNKLKKSCFPN